MEKQLIKCGKFAFIDISKAEGLLIQPSFDDYAIVRITYNDEVSTANIYKVETKELLTQFILELDETCISDSISLPSVTDFIEWFDEERDNFITMIMEEDNDDVADTERK
nr:MAG TPA: hypothetical protein [Bacteriophage sp.]